MELGYIMSPREPITIYSTLTAAGLRSIVIALFLFMRATGALVVVMFTPLMRDPLLVWPFALTVSP